MKNLLWEFINEKSKALGMTQGQLEDASGVSHMVLTAIKNGRTSIKAATKQRLALALKCSTGDIEDVIRRSDQVLADGEKLEKNTVDNLEEMMQEKPYVTPEPEEAYDLTEEEKELNGVESFEDLKKKQHPEGGLHMYNVKCAPKMPDIEIQEIVQDTSIQALVMDAVEKNAHAISEVIKTPAVDNVNHPAHYTQGAVECIDALEASMTPEEFRGYLKGCQMKYVWRYRMKGGVEDLKKARWYLDRLIGKLEEVLK